MNVHTEDSNETKLMALVVSKSNDVGQAPLLSLSMIIYKYG
jgi:hypothetical protein